MTHSIRARNSSLYNSSASSMQPTGFICLHSTVLNQERIHHSLFLSFPPLLPLPPPTSPSQDHSIPVAFPRQLWNGIRVLFLVFSPSPPFWHSLHYYLLGGVQDRFRWRWGMGWEVLNSWSLWNIRSGLPCRVFCCCWCRGNIWDGFHFRIVCILICFAGRGLLRDFWSLELRCGILRIAGSVRHFDNLFGVSKCSIISGLFQDLFFFGGGGFVAMLWRCRDSFTFFQDGDFLGILKRIFVRIYLRFHQLFFSAILSTYLSTVSCGSMEHLTRWW